MILTRHAKNSLLLPRSWSSQRVIQLLTNYRLQSTNNYNITTNNSQCSKSSYLCLNSLRFNSPFHAAFRRGRRFTRDYVLSILIQMYSKQFLIIGCLRLFIMLILNYCTNYKTIQYGHEEIDLGRCSIGFGPCE